MTMNGSKVDLITNKLTTFHVDINVGQKKAVVLKLLNSRLD